MDGRSLPGVNSQPAHECSSKQICLAALQLSIAATAAAVLYYFCHCVLSAHGPPQVAPLEIPMKAGRPLAAWRLCIACCGFILLCHCGAQADLPHVNDCFFCDKCWYTKDKNPDARPTAPRPDLGTLQLAKGMVPAKDLWADKVKKPNCTECWGCTTTLKPLKAISAFGHNFKVETGASSEWLFFADAPDTHKTGKNVLIKVWCLPINKVTGAYMPFGSCDGTDLAIKGAQHLIALDKVTEECGLQDVAVRVWIAPVHAIVPGVGLHIWWNGLWMERAPGLSLNQLAYVGRRDLVQHLVLGLLQEKLNRTQVIRSAIFDLVTSQCDRHSQNVFIDDKGNLKLIDNLNSLRLSWEHCSVDSLFLPGTQKNEIIRFGANLVTKRPAAKPRKSVNPMIVLDYRCYVEGGVLGADKLPADVKKCLTKFAGMSPESVMEEYGFTSTATSKYLVSRAQDMTTKGFEWALKKGEPLNKPSLRYKWHQPCCKLSINNNFVVECGEAWNIKAEMPKGDPTRGGPWRSAFPDPGTFDGETLWDSLP